MLIEKKFVNKIGIIDIKGESMENIVELKNVSKIYKTGEKKGRVDPGRICNAFRAGTSVCSWTGTGKGDCASG